VATSCRPWRPGEPASPRGLRRSAHRIRWRSRNHLSSMVGGKRKDEKSTDLSKNRAQKARVYFVRQLGTRRAAGSRGSRSLSLGSEQRVGVQDGWRTTVEGERKAEGACHWRGVSNPPQLAFSNFQLRSGCRPAPAGYISTAPAATLPFLRF